MVWIARDVHKFDGWETIYAEVHRSGFHVSFTSVLSRKGVLCFEAKEELMRARANREWFPHLEFVSLRCTR